MLVLNITTTINGCNRVGWECTSTAARDDGSSKRSTDDGLTHKLLLFFVHNICICYFLYFSWPKINVRQCSSESMNKTSL